MFRSGILTSKEQVVSSLRVESMARNALKAIGMVAFTAWRGRSGLVAAALPSVLNAASRLWKQPVLKPLVRVAMIAGVVAAAVAIGISRKKRKKKKAQTED